MLMRKKIERAHLLNTRQTLRIVSCAVGSIYYVCILERAVMREEFSFEHN